MFYDGLCPLCQAEILFLSSRNQANLLSFVDVNSVQYRPDDTGVSCQAALDSMYAQYEDGELINGVDVFSAAYERANLSTLAWIFSRPSLRPLLMAAYRFFAKNRHMISRMFGPTALWIVNLVNQKKR